MKRFICCVLALLLGVSICCAFAQVPKAAQSDGTIGRVYAYAPKVCVEIKSSEQINDLKITLDGKEMRDISWKTFDPKADSVRVWLLVDVSGSKDNLRAFAETKEQLKSVCTEVLEANPNNQVVVRIFGETVQDLSYSSQEELLEEIDGLQCRDQYTKLNEALKQTYTEATAQWNGDTFSREYILLFTDGENDEKSEKDPLSEVSEEFSSRMIPVYAVCSADAKKGQPIKHLARNSGGEVLFRGDDSKNFQEFWNEIQQVTLVEAEIVGVPPMGKECTLQISNMEPVTFTLNKQIIDDEPPQAERITAEDGEITVVFSEDVTGADKLSAYTLKSGESQLRIDSVKYDEKSRTATLTVSGALYDGSYTLEFGDIADWQSNTLKQTDMSLTVAGNPRPTVKAAQYDPAQNAFILEFTNGVANANLPSAYEITDSTGHQIKIAAASYDSTAFSVTITPAEGETIYTGQYRIVFSEVRDLSQASAQLETAVCDVEAAKRPIKPAILIILLVCIAALFALVLALVLGSRHRAKKSEEIGVVNEYEAQNAMQIKHHVMAEQSHPIVMYVKIGKTKEQTIQANLSRSLIVGRSASCDVCVDDNKMSRQHFVIEYHEDGFVIRDLDSMNGTWVNGFRLIGSRRLKSGDRVLAGLSDIAIHF